MDMPHVGRVYYWGHTKNVFAAIPVLLSLSKNWKWLAHLHDGAYPVHAPEYMRQYLSERPGVNFMDVRPWDPAHWHAEKSAMVHTCGTWAGCVKGQHFPQKE